MRFIYCDYYCDFFRRDVTPVCFLKKLLVSMGKLGFLLLRDFGAFIVFFAILSLFESALRLLFLSG